MRRDIHNVPFWGPHQFSEVPGVKTSGAKNENISNDPKSIPGSDSSGFGESWAGFGTSLGPHLSSHTALRTGCFRAASFGNTARARGRKTVQAAESDFRLSPYLMLAAIFVRR